jgi:hypothetical protein
VFAHVIGIALGLALFVVLLLQTVKDGLLVLFDTLTLFHALEQGQGGFGTGFGLHPECDKLGGSNGRSERDVVRKTMGVGDGC